MMPGRDAFIGRDAALRDLDTLARASAVVTITGPGGVGKTRLVSEWLGAEGRADACRAAFVRLDGLAGEAAVLGAVAAAVDMPQTKGRPYREAIAQWLLDVETGHGSRQLRSMSPRKPGPWSTPSRPAHASCASSPRAAVALGLPDEVQVRLPVAGRAGRPRSLPDARAPPCAGDRGGRRDAGRRARHLPSGGRTAPGDRAGCGLGRRAARRRNFGAARRRARHPPAARPPDGSPGDPDDDPAVEPRASLASGAPAAPASCPFPASFPLSAVAPCLRR